MTPARFRLYRLYTPAIKLLRPSTLQNFPLYRYSLAFGLILGGMLGPIAGSSGPAWGHGAKIDYRIQPHVSLVARYDTGEPLASATVTIYSPANPTEPWQTLTTDDQGQVQFTPDPTLTGEWAVKVREAGHGGLITLNLDGSTLNLANANANLMSLPTSAQAAALSPVQQGIIAASVIWGFVGTSLYFTRKS
ncbi:MAG: carboxypeptidase regulatory-like domain-containing protein [Prochlorothrix sp.]|nr:hypothetical protein [Prochlorothrix sp.]